MCTCVHTCKTLAMHKCICTYVSVHMWKKHKEEQYTCTCTVKTETLGSMCTCELWCEVGNKECVCHSCRTEFEVLLYQGLIQDFFAEGKILVCNSVHKLGGSGGMLSQENFEIYIL